jgi:hypothetical protein
MMKKVFKIGIIFFTLFASVLSLSAQEDEDKNLGLGSEYISYI